MSRSEDRVLVHRDARGVVNLTLNRPDRNNAYDGALLAAAHQALDQLQTEPAGVRALVIRGAGRHFQAGADLQWLDEVSRQSPQANLEASEATASLMHRITALPWPVVALVQGGCFGGGTGLIASCDVVIASEDAQFSIAESRWGMIASIIIPQLNDAMSVRQVRRYALTGERFDAHTALRIGLVHEVVTHAALEDAGGRILSALLQNGPEATAQTKSCALRSCWSDLSESHARQLIVDHALKRQSAEAAEGLASFREKRPARWSAPGL
jgi:methylglutaconyl-CoA hydratase